MGHFGNCGGRRLYGFALTLCFSRMRYIEFTQSQNIHHLLSCMVHGFRYFGGVTESVLTDRMKTVLIDQSGGELYFNQKFLQFAAYYGFVPRVIETPQGIPRIFTPPSALFPWRKSSSASLECARRTFRNPTPVANRQNRDPNEPDRRLRLTRPFHGTMPAVQRFREKRPE